MRSLGETEGVFARLTHGRHVAHTLFRPADVPHDQADRPSDAGVGPVARPQDVAARIQTQFGDDRAVHADGDRRRSRRAQHAEKIEPFLHRRLYRGQHDRQFRRAAAREDAVVGDGLQCKVAHQRHEVAEGVAGRSAPVDHGAEPVQCRRDQRQPVAEIKRIQRRLRVFPGMGFGEERHVLRRGHSGKLNFA